MLSANYSWTVPSVWINEPFIPRENPEVADTPQMEAEAKTAESQGRDYVRYNLSNDGKRPEY